MVPARKFLSVVALINLISLLAWSQSASTNTAVKIESDTHGMAVQITQPTPLSKVLESVCAAAAATTTCDIAPNIGSEIIAPVQLKGNWMQIVTQLLDGSKLNYAIVPDNGVAQGKLIVAAAPSGDEIQHTSAAEVSAPVQPSSSQPLMMMSEVPAGDVSHMADDSANTAEKTDLLNFGLGAGDSSSGMTITPYSGASGRPLAVPATSQPLSESPYADASGQPMKIYPTGQPLTELPYSDSQGRPLPTPPATSGQPVVPPYPLGPYHR